jgi:hypothetical protein
MLIPHPFVTVRFVVYRVTNGGTRYIRRGTFFTQPDAVAAAQQWDRERVDSHDYFMVQRHETTAMDVYVTVSDDGHGR